MRKGWGLRESRERKVKGKGGGSVDTEEEWVICVMMADLFRAHSLCLKIQQYIRANGTQLTPNSRCLWLGRLYLCHCSPCGLAPLFVALQSLPWRPKESISTEKTVLHWTAVPWTTTQRLWGITPFTLYVSVSVGNMYVSLWIFMCV